MAVSKKKTSKAKRNMRRSHHAIQETSTSVCPNCGEAKLPHRVCLECGFYGDKQVLASEEAAEVVAE